MTAAIPDFDPAQIHDFASVLPAEAVRDLVVSFRANILSLLSALDVAEDLHALREVAHDLKGTSGSFGALKLSALAEHLEHQCGGGSIAETSMLISEMGRAATAALAALETEVATLA